MKLEINHSTTYTYETPVTDSINEVRLTPRSNYRQSCYQHTITTDPAANLFVYEDYLGNRIQSFSVNQPHKSLVIKCHSIVTTQDQEPRAQSRLPVAEELAMLCDTGFQNRYAEFLIATPRVQLSETVRRYAALIADISSHGNVYDTVRAVSHYIHEQCAYEPGTTTVCTTVEDLLLLQRGVCQDFAHLMLAVCRAAGIPARYISGYHFVGDLQGGHTDFEQASHAWVEALIPGVGWLGFDPTNNGIMNWRYVKLGHGRDYFDIVPVKGIYRGSASSRKMEVAVDVRKIDDDTHMNRQSVRYDQPFKYPGAMVRPGSETQSQ